MTDRVLMIDDDEQLGEMVARYLAPMDLEVTLCTSAGDGLEAIARTRYEALILDVMLPDMDGFEVCRRLRADADGPGAAIPILMLTARGEESDRIVGLEMGADDYLPKPFSPRELLARLRAIRRRYALPGSAAGRAVLRFGRLEIDSDRREARVDGEPKSLTGHQFDLLHALAGSAGRVMSREQLMDRVRGESLEAFDRSIDVHVSRIRAAIEDDPKHPRRLITVRGAGYVFARVQDQDGPA